jgi:hypothetical protein
LKKEDIKMNGKYFTLIIILLLTFAQFLIGQNIHFYPESDTVAAIDGCTGAEFTCTLASFNDTDSIIITPGFNTYFEYLDNQGYWSAIDKVYFLVEDSLNTYQYELLYWPLGQLPYFTHIYFDSAYTAWDNYFEIRLIVDSLGTPLDTVSQVFKAQIGLGIDDRDPIKIPFQVALYPNYPNPFNNNTTIRYYLPQRSIIKISLFNALGQLIDVLSDEEQESGEHKITWNADAGIPSGIYYIQLDKNGHRIIRRCALLK